MSKESPPVTKTAAVAARKKDSERYSVTCTMDLTNLLVQGHTQRSRAKSNPLLPLANTTWFEAYELQNFRRIHNVKDDQFLHLIYSTWVSRLLMKNVGW